MDAEDTAAAQPGGVSATGLGLGENRIRGNIVARLDRLPLTPQLWTYALIAQLFWGAVLALDPVALRLYPVIWLPAHAFSHLQYDILVGFENGAGVLIGQVIFTYLGDRYGRKPLMIASCLVASAFVWPVAWLVYTIAHGAISGWYPYPFLDVGRHGYAVALRNCVGVLVIGIVLAFVFALLDRMPTLPARGGVGSG